MLLYYITDREQFPGSESEQRERLLAKIAEAACAGVDYIQLREKNLSSRELEGIAGAAVDIVRKNGSKSRLLLNSRTDIALAVGADGVHLRSNDISPADVRRSWRSAGLTTEPVVAVSCHSESEVVAAKAADADFVVFGPVFGKGEATGTGMEALRAACVHGIPVFALGGVTDENAGSCLQAGAAGIAGIRLFQQGPFRASILEKPRGFEIEHTQQIEGRIADLRNALREAFPVVAYSGPVTRHDGAWLPALTEENAIHDDDMFLYEGLKGKNWTEVSPELLQNFPDGFVLLTDEALVAFLPAWLMQSLDNILGENLVREFSIYAFSPSGSSVVDTKVHLLHALNSKQRAAVRGILCEFARNEMNAFLKEHARAAVQLIDGVTREQKG